MFSRLFNIFRGLILVVCLLGSSCCCSKTVLIITKTEKMKISCFKWGFTKTEKLKLWFSLSYVITFFKKYLPIIAYFKLIQCFFQDWRGFLRIVGSAGFSVLIVFEQSLCNSSQQRGIHFLA